MTDTHIEKSVLCTISEGYSFVAITSISHLLLSLPPRFTGGTFKNLTMIYLVIVPNNVAPEQVASLFDVERVGGKIIESRGTLIEYLGNPNPQPNPHG